MELQKTKHNALAIKYENLPGDHVKITYATTELLMIIKGLYGSYVNATALCNRAGKNFDEWKQQEGESTMASLRSQLAMRPPIIEHTCRTPIDSRPVAITSEQGIHVHPELVLPIALWISKNVFFETSYMLHDVGKRQSKANQQE